jgi:hypothetical protein
MCATRPADLSLGPITVVCSDQGFKLCAPHYVMSSAPTNPAPRPTFCFPTVMSKCSETLSVRNGEVKCVYPRGGGGGWGSCVAGLGAREVRCHLFQASLFGSFLFQNS